MSSVIRVISASGSEVALFSMSTSSRLRIGSSVMRKSSSCEYFLRLAQRTRQVVDLVFVIIEPKRRPAGRRYAVAGQQRHPAMGAGAYRHARAIDDGRDIVRVCA